MNVSVTLNLKTKEATETVLKAAREAMRDTVVGVWNEATRDSPKLTGHNMRSLTGDVSGMGTVAKGKDAQPDKVVDDSKIQGAVYSTSGYGGYLEVGTRPHIITVKTAKVLTDGETFFGKSVRHPGTNPHPYIKPAFDKFGPKFSERMKAHLP
jgi:hypothetical protein